VKAESRRKGGVSSHSIKISFGFITPERLPYLEAAFNKGAPAEILNQAIRSLEKTDAHIEQLRQVKP